MCLAGSGLRHRRFPRSTAFSPAIAATVRLPALSALTPAGDFDTAAYNGSYTAPVGPPHNAMFNARLTATGQIDPSFGVSGTAVANYSVQDGTYAAVSADGRITVAGTIRPQAGYANEDTVLLALAGDSTTSTRTYARHDANFNVTSTITLGGSRNSQGVLTTSVERYSYTPYGVATVLNADFTPKGDSSWSASSLSWKLGFQGGRVDVALGGAGLYNFRNRWYDPVQGRWTQADPSGYADGLNVFPFVQGNPFKYVDPLGLQAWYQRWGNLAYAWLGGYGAVAAARVGYGAIEGALQGVANTANGTQDAVIGIANIPATVVNLFTRQEAVPYIPSPDWSRGLVHSEGDFAHSTSKFLGGQGVVTLATLGLSQVGTAKSLFHLTTRSAAASIEANAAAGLGLARSGFREPALFATTRVLQSNLLNSIRVARAVDDAISIPSTLVAGVRPIPAVGPISAWARFAAQGYVYCPVQRQVVDAVVGQVGVAAAQVLSQDRNCVSGDK